LPVDDSTHRGRAAGATFLREPTLRVSTAEDRRVARFRITETIVKRV
jgi:hypothetical protein